MAGDPDRPEGSTLGFRPSRHGFHFANDWPRGAPVRIWRFTVLRIRAGMCGGMCVAAGRQWRAGTAMPADTAAPAVGPLADLIWRSQLASLRLPLGPLRYLWLQLPRISPGTRRRITLGEAVPAVRQAVAAGAPQVLGLVRTTSWSPLAASRNHQVLAYGHERAPDGGALVIRIYDPNWPDDDDVRLTVYPDGRVEHSDGEPVTVMFPTG